MPDALVRREPDSIALPPEPISLTDLLSVFLRRRNLIYACILAGLLLGITAILLSKTLYHAYATLQLLKDQPASQLTTLPDAASSDALDFNLTLQTQLTLLRSDIIAISVINELGLEQNDVDYRFRPESSAPSAEEMNQPLAASPRRLSHAIATFRKRLRVDAVPGTRVIVVAYEDPKAETAANVANRVVQDFAQYNFDVRHSASVESTDWLQEQLRGLKADVERSRAAVADLAKQSGVFGPDETHNLITAQMEQLNTEMVNAEGALVNRRAIAQAAKSGDPNLISGLISSGPTASGMNPLVQLLETLQAQASEARAALAALTSQFGPNYPKVIEARQRLLLLEQAANTETERIRTRADTEYQVALAVRDSTQKALNKQKDAATALNDRTVDYAIAKREADSKDALYQQLLGKLTEAQAFAGLRASDIHVVDKATVPERPAKPVQSTYLLGGLLGGTILGLALALLLDLVDSTVRDPEAVERMTGLPLLGTIPLGTRKALGDLRDIPTRNGTSDRFYGVTAVLSGSRVGESLNSLSSNIFDGDTGPGCRVIAVTSPAPGDGKAFTSLNLAAALSQQGRRVLLVDADLRRGKISSFLGMDNSLTGAGSVLTSDHDAVASSTKPWPLVSGVSVLPRGPVAGVPAKIVSSPAMADFISKARENFDVIILDTPPLLPVVDAVAISRLADLTIVVLRFGKTTKAAVRQSVRLLGNRSGSAIGFVLNGMDPTGPDFKQRVGTEEYTYVTR